MFNLLGEKLFSNSTSYLFDGFVEEEPFFFKFYLFIIFFYFISFS